ncbi:MAG: TOBE domain-containing protein [Thermoanaerobaculia bacterium]
MATTSPSGPFTAAQAARLLGVSHQTIKQWIYKKRIRAARTPGGHHRIPASEVRRLSGAALAGAPAFGMDAISGRNKLRGSVTRIRVSGLLAEVSLDVGGQELTAIITSAAAKQLRLKAGSPAVALIKATEVMVIGA